MTSINWVAENGGLTTNGIRYIAMRTDVLMNAIHALDASAQAEFLNALSQTAEKFGGESVKQYALETSSRGNNLLKIVASNAAALGWGEWRFESGTSSSGSERKIEFTVTNSPFALLKGDCGTPMCAAIVGIIKSTTEQAFRGTATVEEYQCKSQGYEKCVFKVIVQNGN